MLRQATSTDSPLFGRILTNPETRRYLGGPIEQRELAKKIADIQSRGVFVAERKRDHVGLGLIYVGRYRTGDLELSYEFLPEYWGNGYALETCTVVVDWAFANLNDNDRIVAVTQAANNASLALSRRLGMTECERFEEWGEPQVMLEKSRPGSR